MHLPLLLFIQTFHKFVECLLGASTMPDMKQIKLCSREALILLGNKVRPIRNSVTCGIIKGQRKSSKGTDKIHLEKCNLGTF